MRRLATLAVVAALMSPTTASGQNYTFGDWARDHGYSPGDVMPEHVYAGWDWWDGSPTIDRLDGIGEFDWTTTPTTILSLDGNQITRIESGAFTGLTSLLGLALDDNNAMTKLKLEAADFSNLLPLFRGGI